MPSSLDNLNARLRYQGGNQEGRFQQDKLTSLRRALLYSYQAETIFFDTINSQGKLEHHEFRALINTDKTKGDYDNKIISIPYEDIDLGQPPDGKTNPGRKPTLLKPGDGFCWKTKSGVLTHWIIWLQHLNEDAYFRADIRKCEKQIDVNHQKYWVYLRGPVETTIPWNQKASTEWNDINYSLVMYIKKDQNTLDFFHRFTKVKIGRATLQDGAGGPPETWQVAAVNPYYGDGIIEVFLDEYYENRYEASMEKQKADEEKNKPLPPEFDPYIQGPDKVQCLSKAHFELKNYTKEGAWFIQYNNKQIDLKSNKTAITIDMNISRPGKCKIIFRSLSQGDIEKNITLTGF